MPKFVEPDLPDPGPLRPVIPALGAKFLLSRNRHFVARNATTGQVLFCRVVRRLSGRLMRCEVINGGWYIVFDENGNGFLSGTREAYQWIETVFPEQLKDAQYAPRVHYEVAIGWSAMVVREAAKGVA